MENAEVQKQAEVGAEEIQLRESLRELNNTLGSLSRDFPDAIAELRAIMSGLKEASKHGDQVAAELAHGAHMEAIKNSGNVIPEELPAMDLSSLHLPEARQDALREAELSLGVLDTTTQEINKALSNIGNMPKSELKQEAAKIKSRIASLKETLEIVRKVSAAQTLNA